MSIQNFTGKNSGIWNWNDLRYHNHNPDKAHSLTQLLPNRIRFEIQEGEHWDGDGSSLNRSDTVAYDQGDWFDKDRDIVIKYKMMIEPGDQNKNWLVLTQAHPNQNTGSPALAMTLGGSSKERLGIEIRDSSETWKKIWTDNEDIQRGRWYDIRLDVKFGSDGYLRIIVDDSVRSTYDGSIGYTSAIWWAFGPYRPAGDATLAVQFEDMQIMYAEDGGPDPEPEPPEPEVKTYAIITWERNLNIRPGATMYNSGIGYFLYNAKVPLIEILENDEGEWGKVADGLWIALWLKSNNQRYADAIEE